MKAFLAILTTLSFLTANLYLSLGIHYCGSRPADSEIFVHDHELGCGMEEGMAKEKTSSFTPTGFMISKKPCCSDDFSGIQIRDEFSFSKIVIEIPSFAKITNLYWFDLVTFLKQNIQAYSFVPERPPPLEAKDIRLLFQVFLL